MSRIQSARMTLMIAGTGVALFAGLASADTKPAPAPAPVSAEPQNTAAEYGDWTVRCVRANEASPRVCEMQYVLQAQTQQGQAATIAQIAMARPTPKDAFKLVVTVPPNVSFPSSVKLGLDDKDPQPIEISWLRCLSGGCFAVGDLKEDDLKRWRAQTASGHLMFKDGSGKEQNWPFSLRGFAQALDGLAKS